MPLGTFFIARRPARKLHTPRGGKSSWTCFFCRRSRVCGVAPRSLSLIVRRLGGRRLAGRRASGLVGFTTRPLARRLLADDLLGCGQRRGLRLQERFHDSVGLELLDAAREALGPGAIIAQSLEQRGGARRGPEGRASAVDRSLGSVFFVAPRRQQLWMQDAEPLHARHEVVAELPEVPGRPREAGGQLLQLLDPLGEAVEEAQLLVVVLRSTCSRPCSPACCRAKSGQSWLSARKAMATTWAADSGASPSLEIQSTGTPLCSLSSKGFRPCTRQPRLRKRPQLLRPFRTASWSLTSNFLRSCCEWSRVATFFTSQEQRSCAQDDGGGAS